MARKYGDLLWETTTTTGTGDLTLGGAKAGYRAFSALCANGDTVPYVIRDPTTGAFETGIGTWNTGGTLSRTTVLESSNAGALVNLGAGIKNVYSGLLGTMLGLALGVATLDANGIIPLAQLPVSTPQAPQGQGTFLSEGGNYAYVSGLTLRVSAGVAYINFTRTPFSATNVTLSAADATHPRQDAIVVDSAGAVGVVDGVAAANPALPDLDPLTQAVITYILVPATATTLAITTTDLYKEAAEWTPSQSGGTINTASTNNPYAGTKDIEATASTNGHYFRLTIPAGSQDFSAAKQLVLQLRSKAAWPTQKSLLLTWYSSGTKIGQSVAIANGQFGFNAASTASYQQIVIPIALFSIPSGATATILEGKVNGGGAAIGFYVDNIVLESTSTASAPPPTSVDAVIWAAQVKPWVPLTDAATIVWDVTNIAEAKAKVTLGGNRTLSIVGATNGQRGVLKATQDGTGSRGLTLPTGSIQVGGGGTAAGLSTAAGTADLLAWEFDGTNYIWTIGKAAA